MKTEPETFPPAWWPSVEERPGKCLFSGADVYYFDVCDGQSRLGVQVNVPSQECLQEARAKAAKLLAVEMAAQSVDPSRLLPLPSSAWRIG